MEAILMSSFRQPHIRQYIINVSMLIAVIRFNNLLQSIFLFDAMRHVRTLTDTP